MKSYKKSRGASTNDIYLLKAGTLRYKLEICYVVMVAMSDDLDDIGLPGIYQSEEDKRLIDPNSCINSCGKLITDEQSPNFRIRRPISWIRGKGGVSWEDLVKSKFNKDIGLELPKCWLFMHTY